MKKTLLLAIGTSLFVTSCGDQEKREIESQTEQTAQVEEFFEHQIGEGQQDTFEGDASQGDKTACIINLISMQKTIRSVQNIMGQNTGDSLQWSLIVGPNAPMSVKPTCPAGGAYTLSPVITEIGTSAVKCSCPGHEPTDTTDW